MRDPRTFDDVELAEAIALTSIEMALICHCMDRETRREFRDMRLMEAVRRGLDIRREMQQQAELEAFHDSYYKILEGGTE